MSTSNGEQGPLGDGEVPGAESEIEDNVFAASVDAGDVVTAATGAGQASGLMPTDPALEVPQSKADIGFDATTDALVPPTGGADIGFDATTDALTPPTSGADIGFDATTDALTPPTSGADIGFDATTDALTPPSSGGDLGFDATSDAMAFDPSMDEAEFESKNAAMSFTETEPELAMVESEVSTAPGISTGFGAVTEEQPPSSDSDAEVVALRRKLDSAKSELRIVVSQLNDLEKIRSYALQRGSEILMLKARQVSLESEVDLYRELTEQYRTQCQGLEVQLRDAHGVDDGLGLGEADAEIGTLQDELTQALRERDAAFEASERLKSDLATLRASDSREPLLARIEELEAALAASQPAGNVGEEHAQLEARAHALQADLFKAQSDATEAEQRADRLKIALERLRQAFVKTAEQSERVPDLEAEIERLAASLEQAQTAPPESLAAKRIEELEGALDLANRQVSVLESEGAGQGAEFQARLDELTAELEAAQGLSVSLGADGDAVAEVAVLRKKTTDLELQVSDLTRQLELAADRVASAPATGDGSDGGDRLERLRLAVQRSSAQVQRLLLELEGSRGSVQRARRDMQRYSRSVNALHEALNHLERYLIGAGPQAQQGVVLLQEVKRCAHDVRAMVESNERFGRSMSKVVDRLSSIISEP